MDQTSLVLVSWSAIYMHKNYASNWALNITNTRHHCLQYFQAKQILVSVDLSETTVQLLQNSETQHNRCKFSQDDCCLARPVSASYPWNGLSMICLSAYPMWQHAYTENQLIADVCFHMYVGDKNHVLFFFFFVVYFLDRK